MAPILPISTATRRPPALPIWQPCAGIAGAAKDAGREPAAVTLVAVSKMQSAERVTAALAAGQRVFGENRVQEAVGKWPELKRDLAAGRAPSHRSAPDQQGEEAVALFDVIETVDRPKLAQVLAAEMTRSGRRPACYVQINTGEEPQKAGVVPAAADAFIRYCREEAGLPVVGLMCIPPADDEPSLHFALLAELARRHGIDALSMGMSADYEIAIKLGATHVRIGTAIFGDRPPPRRRPNGRPRPRSPQRCQVLRPPGCPGDPAGPVRRSPGSADSPRWPGA